MSYDFSPIADVLDVLDALYASLSGPPGERDWDARHECFHPGAKLIRTGVDENGAAWLKVMTLDEYRDDVAFTSSASRSSKSRPSAASSSSATSRKSGASTKSAPVERRGINAIQLFRDQDRRWRIMSIIWDNEREGVKLPD